MVYDVHTHTFPTSMVMPMKVLFWRWGVNSMLGSVYNLRKNSKGIDVSFMHSISLPFPEVGDIDFDDWAVKVSREHHGIYGFVSPRHIEYLKYKNIYGVKFHRYVQKIDEFELIRAFNLLEKKKKLMMFHISSKLTDFERVTKDYLKMFTDLMTSYPKVRVIIPHFTAFDYLLNFEQIYFDTAFVHRHQIQDAVEEHNAADRILFGSDFPFSKPDKDYKKKILTLDISKKDKNRILSENARKLVERIR